MKNNIKHISWFWVAICLLLAVLLILVVRNYHQDVDYEPRVCGGDGCFIVELARTSAEHKKGLMNRASMPEMAGMIFIFPKADFHNFRMKDTLIPLDMLRIDDQLNVVKIMTAQPCITGSCAVYKPEIYANYVLEINAGMAEKYGIQEGTHMRFVNIQ